MLRKWSELGEKTLQLPFIFFYSKVQTSFHTCLTHLFLCKDAVALDPQCPPVFSRQKSCCPLTDYVEVDVDGVETICDCGSRVNIACVMWWDVMSALAAQRSAAIFKVMIRDYIVLTESFIIAPCLWLLWFGPYFKTHRERERKITAAQTHSLSCFSSEGKYYMCWEAVLWSFNSFTRCFKHM